MSPKETLIEKEDKPSRRGSPGFLVAGSLVAVLVWGSAILVLAIAHLRSVSQQVNVLESLNTRLYYDDYSVLDTSNRLSFNQTRNSSFSAHYKTIQWIRDPDSFLNDKGYYSTEDDNVYSIKSIEDQSYEKLLFNGSVIHKDGVDYEIDDFISSPDLKYALIQTNWTQHWRHSSYGLYWLLDVETQSLKLINDKKLSLAKWSPTSDHIAIVLENNVYVYELETESTTQATFDGSANIFNGKPDWVYEEEVFSTDTALWWSPSGEYVAFLRTNETLVPEFPITYFVQDDEEFAYPLLKNIKYPKPGYPNPSVELALFNLKEKSTEYVDYSYDIFTEILWVGDSKLLLKSTNRESDFLKVIIINAQDLSYEIVRDEITDSWFEITQETLFIPKSSTRENDGYIDSISVGGFNHLAYFSPPSNSTPHVLTSGDWEVVSAPSAFDYSKNLVFYFSTEVSSIERHLYSIDLITGEKQKYTEGEAWYSASFSAGARYVSLSYRGPGIPSQKLLDLYSGDVQVLETNDHLKVLLSDYELPQIKFGEVDIGTAVVNYVERLPPNFDSSKKYPILFFVYGGPGSQLVTKTHQLSFPEVVSAQLDAVVVTVDGRGTGFKGRQFRSLVRDNLGYYEVIDQIAAAKTWAKKSYIDKDRIAMFGWSYGGFMTLKTLEADAGETFKYGMSVAPVTNWLLYDSIYTERYMHTPQNNSDGYYEGSVHNVTQIGKAERFLLCHGTGDDNVHFQNSAKFLDKLDLEGVENYDVHVFPDSDHAIRYHSANDIIYDKLLLWLKKAFRGDFLHYN